MPVLTTRPRPLVTLAADADCDGIDDAIDNCELRFDADGAPWASHSRYVRCVRDEVFRFRLLRLVTAEQADAIRAEAVASSCGYRPPVCEQARP